jgi:hypothetical protein
MKWILLVISIITVDAWAACNTATRSNFTTGQVLTSSRLNSEFNNVLTAINAYDGGCINSGSVEAAALDSTEFAPLLKGVVQGCEASYVDSNTVGISKCKIAVDGNLFETSSQNNVTWGCSGCASEGVGAFYVYVKDASTFTLSISSTAPGKDGYNGTDKAVGAFYNNTSSNIATASVMSFLQSDIAPPSKNIPRVGESASIFYALISATGGLSFESEDMIAGDCTNATPSVCTWQTGAWNIASPVCTITPSTTSSVFCHVLTGSSSVDIYCKDDAGANVTTSTIKQLICIGRRPGF